MRTAAAAAGGCWTSAAGSATATSCWRRVRRSASTSIPRRSRARSARPTSPTCARCRSPTAASPRCSRCSRSSTSPIPGAVLAEVVRVLEPERHGGLRHPEPAHLRPRRRDHRSVPLRRVLGRSARGALPRLVRSRSSCTACSAPPAISSWSPPSSAGSTGCWPRPAAAAAPGPAARPPAPLRLAARPGPQRARSRSRGDRGRRLRPALRGPRPVPGPGRGLPGHRWLMGRRLREAEPATLVFAGVALLSAAALLYWLSDLTFWRDEWDFLLHRRDFNVETYPRSLRRAPAGPLDRRL